MADEDVVSPTPEQQIDDLRTQAALLERKLSEFQEQSDMRLILAEMKIAAVRAGMLDLDGLKLLDVSQVRLNDQREVENASEMMAKFKRAKPWLFGSSSSSSPLNPPSAQPPRQKYATEMSNTEYAAARAALLKQRY